MTESVQLPLPLGNAHPGPAESVDCGGPKDAAFESLCAALANLAADWWRRQAHVEDVDDCHSRTARVERSPGEDPSASAAKHGDQRLRPRDNT